MPCPYPEILIPARGRSPANGAPTPSGPQYVLSGEIQDFTPEDNADFYADFADKDDRGIVSNLLGPDGLPGARLLRPACLRQGSPSVSG